MTSPFIGRYVAFLISTCATAPAVALAQPGPVDDKAGTQLEDIVVTAQKVSQNAQDVPISVTAFSAEALAKAQLTDITDLSGRAPNLQISQQGTGPGALSLSVRGIFSQEIERSFEPGVGVILDGVYLSTSNGIFLQNFDIDSIQVLRGPQGTLQGKNNTGGAIIVTRSKADPDGRFRGKVKLTTGSFGRHDVEAVVSTPIIPGVLAAKVAMFSQNDNGAWKNTVFNRRQGKRDYQAGSISMTFTPSSETELWMTYDRIDDRSQLPPRIAVFTNDIFTLPIPGYVNGASAPCSNPNLPDLDCSGKPPRGRNIVTQDLSDEAEFRLDAVTLNAVQKLRGFDVVFVGGYRDIRQDDFLDVDGTQYPLYQDRRPETFYQLSGELRVESKLDGPFNVIGGVYYFKSKYSLDNFQQLDFALAAPLPIGVAILPFGYSTTQHSESTALFLDANLQITDDVQVFGGFRHTWDRKNISLDIFSGGTIGDFDSFGPLVDSGRRRARFKLFTPRVGIKYDVAERINLYATFSRGANSGGFNGRAAAPALLGPYRPEYLNAYELGFKSEFFDRRVRLNAAVFYNEFSDKQEEVLVSVPVAPFTGTSVTNVAAATYKGVEVELDIIPAEGLTVSLSGSHLDAQYDNFDAALRPGFPVTDNTVLTLRRAPRWNGSVTGDYVVSAGGGELGFNASARFISKYFTDSLNDPRSLVPDTIKVDASARFDFEARGIDWRASFFVKNITDQTPISSFLGSGGIGEFVTFVGQDIGRTWGLSLAAKF